MVDQWGSCFPGDKSPSETERLSRIWCQICKNAECKRSGEIRDSSGRKHG